MDSRIFSNALVAVVGAYSGALAEAHQANEQLTAALRQPRPSTPRPAPGSPAQAVIEAARAVLNQTSDEGIAGAIARLGDAMTEFDRVET